MKKHNIQNIIEIGEKLFKSKGYHNTGTEEIMKLGAYPRSSFYYNFKNKEGFAIRVLENYGEKSVKFYHSVLLNSDIKSPKNRLILFANSLAEQGGKNDFSSECLIQKLSTECAGLNENMRINTNRQYQKLIEVISTCIKEGQEKGELTKEFDSIDLASSYQAKIYGSFIQARLGNDANLMKKLMKLEVDNMSI